MRLLRDGRKVAEVASRTARAASTIEGYLIELIEAEGIEDPSPWVPRAIVATIEAAADKDGSGRMKPIFDFFGGEVPYSQIRIVLACRRNRAG